MSQEVKVMTPIDVAQLFSLCNFSTQIGDISKNMVRLSTAPILQHHLLEEQLLSLNGEQTSSLINVNNNDEMTNNKKEKKKRTRKNRNKNDNNKNNSNKSIDSNIKIENLVEPLMKNLNLNNNQNLNKSNRKNEQNNSVKNNESKPNNNHNHHHHKEHLQHHHNLHQPYHHSHHLNLHNNQQQQHNHHHHHHQVHHNQVHQNKVTKPKSDSKPAIYEEYWSDEQIKQGLANKTLIDGKIRINQRNYEDAFVNDPNGGSDLYISGMKDRNRALNNDIVALKVKEKYYWKILDAFKERIKRIVTEFGDESAAAAVQQQKDDESLLTTRKDSTSGGEETLIETGKKDLTDLAPKNYSNKDLLMRLDDNWFQRTAVVVGIIEKKNNRYSAGHLKLFPDKNKDWVQFSPNDSRIPRMRIKMKQCPKDFYTNPQIYANTIFIARIVDIPINSRYAIGELKKMIGREGDVEVETEAILIENGIDYSEFDECINECLPKTPWRIPQSEYETRRDLRNYCIFTIVSFIFCFFFLIII